VGNNQEEVIDRMEEASLEVTIIKIREGVIGNHPFYSTIHSSPSLCSS
jgi:hypothetical protein